MQLFIRNVPEYEPEVGWLIEDKEPIGKLTHSFHILNKSRVLALTADQVSILIPFDFKLYMKLRCEYFFIKYQKALGRLEEKIKEYQND